MSVPDGSDPAALAHWLFERARAGEAQRLGAYVDAGVPVDLIDAAGNTLLTVAAQHGHAPAVAALLERGARVDAVNAHGQTPLAAAVLQGWEDVIRLLVAAGANPDAGAPTARQTALFFGRPDVVALLDPPSASPGDVGSR